MPQKKYTIGMDEKLMERVDEFAQELHISRSAALAVLSTMALDQRRSLNTLTEMMQYAKVQQLGIVMPKTEETKE